MLNRNVLMSGLLGAVAAVAGEYTPPVSQFSRDAKVVRLKSGAGRTRLVSLTHNKPRNFGNNKAKAAKVEARRKQKKQAKKSRKGNR